MPRARRTALALVLAAMSLPAGCREPHRLREPVRAVWVTRWDYRTPQDIHAIIDNARHARLNTVLLQVRGEACAAYRSAIEPWSPQFGWQDPGFDPLAVAVARAHAAGIRLHAWINVLPAWKGRRPPTHPRHVLNAHPAWRLFDASGVPQPLGEHYVILNPCLPAVQEYLAAVAGEIASRYDVDGIHLDYIRFTEGTIDRYPRDPETLRLFRLSTGHASPDDAPGAWNRWREGALRRLVWRIRETVHRLRSDCEVSAALIADRRRATREFLQDGAAWLREGLIDRGYIMAYTPAMQQFQQWLADWDRAAPRDRIVPGIGIYRHRDDRTSFEQLRLCYEQDRGFALFAYASLFPSASPADPPCARRRDRRLANLLPTLRRIAELHAAGAYTLAGATPP